MSPLAAVVTLGCALAIGRRSAPIDDHAALLLSRSAPLAELGVEHQAVWAAVGGSWDGSVLVYFHGNDSFVTATAASPDGVVPGWAHPLWDARVAEADRARPLATAVEHDLAALAAASPWAPAVLAPEDGVPAAPRSIFWAKTDAGRLVTDRRALGTLVDDALLQLHRLRRPGGPRYLPTRVRASQVRRLFLAGHSGGGRPLAAAAQAQIAQDLPTDLWLFDGSYGFADEASHYAAFCAAAKRAGRLDNGPRGSRFVTVYTSSSASGIPDITAAMRARGLVIAGTLAEAERADGQRADGVMMELSPEDPPDLEEAALALRRFPIVFLKTSSAHRTLPDVFLPALWATAGSGMATRRPPAPAPP